MGLLLAGCGEPVVSALAPAGEAAADIAWITWAMLSGAAFFTLLMTALGLHAVYRRADRPMRVSAFSVLIWGGLALPLSVTLLLLVYGIPTGHSMLPLGQPDLEVRVTGHQWWWQFEHADADGRPLYTANELHLPVDRTVDIHITSADVIHAFWVPVLGGKLDAIPGSVNTLRLRPTRVGVYRGQCAEFCGAQHARMAFEVHVHEPEDFERYLEALAHQDRTHVGTAEDRQVFAVYCAICHSTTPQVDRFGPNLARISERGWLGAGAVMNDADNLRRWIALHQALKPGNRMPDHSNLDAEDVEALARYLEAVP
jgi:cytochrome c oxidase subunit II